MTESLSLLTKISHVVPNETIIELNKNFEWCASAPDAYLTPDDISTDINWKPAIVPGTVAMLIQDETSLATLDTEDHWYRTTFEGPNTTPQKILLQLDGLLTHADVYLNNKLILQSRNAFHHHVVDITDNTQPNNQLAICFRALQPVYRAKHPRARYTTRLINERHLRFIRTPVLGYAPGFSSATKAVGPYRPIRLIYQNDLSITACQVSTLLIKENVGQIDSELSLITYNATINTASLIVKDIANGTQLHQQTLNISKVNTNQYIISGQSLIENIQAYWPHTHGEPTRYQLLILLNEESPIEISLGNYGFKRIERINENSFALSYNNVPIFFRGACWTPMNATSLLVNQPELKARLMLLRDAGMNMLRVPGNMLYESDDFYEICDELGILIFQDFAFANFDYPETDEFIQSVEKEITDFLNKHGNRPCMTVLSGGSEVAQQAGMMGLNIEETRHPLFNQHIAAIARDICPYIPYVASSPTASTGLPFHAGDGPCNYHGVGGYLRPLEDAKTFKGRFISECLPFSHIPEDESLRKLWGGEIPAPHHPLWKEGVTRDPGSGWDFSDVTDFYTEALFNISVFKTRSIDQERYLEYCRAALVETVETTMSIFRADSATGRAALVWNLHDLKPGAGWGYIDSLGQPKSAFYALARTAQPTSLLFVDEGLEGLAIYLAHDKQSSIKAQLTVSLITEDGKVYSQKSTNTTINAQSVTRYSVDTIIGHFVDSSYAYHFGPRGFIACVAQLADEHGTLITQKVYAPVSETHTIVNNIGISATASKINDGEYLLTVSTQLPAYFVAITLNGFKLENNYFHVMPGFDQQVKIYTDNLSLQPQGRLRALNTKASYAIKLAENDI